MANQGNGEARQYSFTLGEISPEKYYTPNEVTYQQGLAKAENIIVKASGGVATRAGTIFEGSIPAAVNATDAQVPHEISFQHPITKKFHTITFQEMDTGGHMLLVDGIEVMDELKRKDYRGYPTFNLGDGGKIVIPDNVKLSFTMSSEYLIITPAVRLYSDTFEGYPDLSYFGGDEVSGYFTESILAVAFSKPFEYADYYTHDNGMRLIANFGGSLYTPLRDVGDGYVKVTASGAGTAPAATARVSYVITAVRKDGTEEMFMTVRSNDTASSNITFDNHIVCRQFIDPASTGALYYPDSGYKPSLLIENIILSKDIEGLPKLKAFNIYRGIENDPNFVTTFSLVNRFPVFKNSSTNFRIKFTDYGESDPSITPPMDRTFYIQNPSIVEMGAEISGSTFSPNKIVSAAFYQSRLFVGLEKSEVFDNEATTSNTIMASKLNAPEQMCLPLITNPAEAFTFQVPEESGGYLTHLAASSKLIAFTNKSVFVFMGDEAGTLSPLALNPVKVFQVGAKAGVPPCTFGEYTFFAMEGVPSIGFIRISPEGSIAYGDALPISRHIFEEKGDSIVAMKVLNGPDSSQIRAQVLTERNKLIELTGTEGVFGISRVLQAPGTDMVPVALIENKTPIQYKSLATQTGGAFYRKSPSGVKYIRLPYYNLSELNTASKLFTPYVDMALTEGIFDSGISWAAPNMGSTEIPYNTNFLKSNYSMSITFVPGITDWSPGIELPIDLVVDQAGIPGEIPEQYLNDERDFAIKFYAIDEYGNEQVCVGTLVATGDLDGDPYKLVFAEEVPVLFQEKVFKMYCFTETYSNFESDFYKAGTTGLAVLAANKLIVPAGHYDGYFETLAEVRNVPIIAGESVQIGLFADGEVISDLEENSIETVALYKDMGVDGFFWEVDFGGAFYSTINIGIPFIAEVQTLPVEVAVGQGDSISDAGKLISAVSVSLYRTDGLEVGEFGQPDEFLEQMDFTTVNSPVQPVKFNGVKEYNFSSSWNKHGMIVLRSKPFRGFSISSITPKGNVSV